MYHYKTERKFIFTEDGQKDLKAVRTIANALINITGCFKVGKLNDALGSMTWSNLACVDYLVETGELFEITDKNIVTCQQRIFTNSTYNEYYRKF
jgi:hypothetical protein